MKPRVFVFFVTTVLVLYVACNAYLFVRAWQGLELLGDARGWFSLGFWTIAAVGIGVQFVRFWGARGRLFDGLSVIGGLWMAVMLYGLLAVLLIDLGRLFLRLSGLGTSLQPSPVSKALLMGIVCTLIAGVIVWGAIRAYRPRITSLSLRIDKPAGGRDKLRLALVSDLHLGHINGRRSLQRIVEAINRQSPDVVILAGDTFDGGPAPVIRVDKGAPLQALQTICGVYAVSGNHEYIGRMEQPDALERAFEYLATKGVVTLQDQSVSLGGCTLLGRKDREDPARSGLTELLQPLDATRPILVIDHQPYDFERAEAAGVDLMLAGHTHHGQLWPLGYLTRALFEQDWGYLRRGRTHFYVCCGTGTWGPPVRTSGYAEIAILDLTFNAQ